MAVKAHRFEVAGVKGAIVDECLSQAQTFIGKENGALNLTLLFVGK